MPSSRFFDGWADDPGDENDGWRHPWLPCGDDDEVSEQPDPTDPPKCPECRGTGKYVGLNEVETCDRCGGSGY